MRENYQGGYDSPADWSEQLLEDTGDLVQIPERFVIEIGRHHHVFWSR
jgi:hypothetical protein